MRNIVQTPGVLGGKPRIDGTRISVEMILEDLSHGMTPADILESYESLTLEDVQTAIAFAISLVQAQPVAAE